MMNAQQGVLLAEDLRQHPRRSVRLDATVSCMKSGLRGFVSRPAVVLNLSEGGCMVSCTDTDQLTNDLHIQIVGIPAKIACTVVGRTSICLNLQFNELVPTPIVERLAARHF